jgi:hypothetical protein
VLWSEVGLEVVDGLGVVVDWLAAGISSAVPVVVVVVVEVVAAGVSVESCVDISVVGSSWPCVAQEQSTSETTLARFLTCRRMSDLRRTSGGDANVLTGKLFNLHSMQGGQLRRRGVFLMEIRLMEIRLSEG